MLLDELSRKEFAKNKNSIIGFIIMASYLYYHKPDYPPILSDHVYDRMCKYLLSNYDTIQHRLKYLIDKEDLSAGSLYKLGYNEYPYNIRLLAIELSEAT